MSKLHNQIASWDTKFETGTKTALLQPFSPVVIASDENERIRWVYIGAQCYPLSFTVDLLMFSSTVLW